MRIIKKQNKVRGFSLTELLVVLVIIGILTLLALPVFMPMISKAKSTEAQVQLKHLYTLQQSHFYMHSKYSDEIDEIGYEQARLVDAGGNANYEIEIINASENGFTATATAIVDFDKDGVFNLWQIDENQELKEITKD
jgi:type IV pilus assembly protein PilE